MRINRTTAWRRNTLLVPILVALAGCAGADTPGTVVRTDSAGLTIVTSAGPDRSPPFVLEREWSVGGVGSDVELTEILPWHVAAGSGGRVYVLDAAGQRVLVLGPGGAVEDTLGRGGGGPGELMRPISVAVSPDGAVGVWDQGRGAVVAWRDGEPLLARRVAASFWGPDLRLLGGGVAFVARSRESPAQRLVVTDSAVATALVELDGVPDRPAEFPTCGIRGIPVPPLFAPELNWDVVGEAIVASVSAGYEIRLVDPSGGATRAIWRRAVQPRAVTEALALREVGDGLRIPVADCMVPPAEVVRGRGYADVVPAIRRLAVDMEGRTWVLRGGLTDEPNVVDIFEGDGAYLGTLARDAPAPVAFPAPDRVVGLETDDLGVRVLTSWRIRR
jgi:hypothetical protein